MNAVEYIENKDISPQQWDACIKRSFNGSIEAYSWYLNTTCERWDAIIEGDYKTVMPLPVKKILGHAIVYMPPFVNQLGIYSPEHFTADKTSSFITLLKKRFRYVDLYLNKYTPVPADASPFRKDPYYELDLIRPYTKIINGYSLETRNKIHVATAKRYSIIRGIALNDLITLLKHEKIIQDPAITKKDNKLIKMLVSSVIRFKTGELYGAYNEFNMLGCAALFVWSHNEVIMLFCAATDEALHDHAPLLLFDQFIEKNTEINSTLSFYYSSRTLPLSVYAGFGSTQSHSRKFYHNRLPLYLKPFI